MTSVATPATTVLAFYRQPEVTDAIKIPEDKLVAVDAVLTKRQGIKIGGTHYQDEQIIGLFSDQEWQNLKGSLLKPPPKTMEDMRKEDWYIRAKRGNNAR